MLRHWVVRDRCFGVKNISNSRIDTATVYCQTRNCIKDYARYCGVTKAINNAWCRKTYSTIQVRMLLCTLTLGELLMPEELVMAVTNHRSSKQMRRDYGTRDNALLVPHQQWIRNPPTIRAQASRALSLYQHKMLIVRDNSKPFHKQRWKCTVEQYTLHNNMTDKLEKLTETILERARKETKEYNRWTKVFCCSMISRWLWRDSKVLTLLCCRWFGLSMTNSLANRRRNVVVYILSH